MFYFVIFCFSPIVCSATFLLLPLPLLLPAPLLMLRSPLMSASASRVTRESVTTLSTPSLTASGAPALLVSLLLPYRKYYFFVIIYISPRNILQFPGSLPWQSLLFLFFRISSLFCSIFHSPLCLCQLRAGCQPPPWCLHLP